ncbi:hypothetical protein FQR65_LT19277 [Abscondita terminalis]|nr:hypothetical protein FQR65_LT19277 [Abscondita terminalis]
MYPKHIHERNQKKTRIRYDQPRAVNTSATTTSATSTSATTSSSQHIQQMLQETTFPTPNTSRGQRTGIKRKAAEQESDSMMRKAMQILKSSVNSSNDAYVTYALNLANELRKYDQKTLEHVKRALTNVLFEADMGMYSALFNMTILSNTHPRTVVLCIVKKFT